MPIANQKRIIKTGPSRNPPNARAPLPKKRRRTELESLQLFSWDKFKDEHPPNFDSFNLMRPIDLTSDDVEESVYEFVVDDPLPFVHPPSPPPPQAPAAAAHPAAGTSVLIKPEPTDDFTGHVSTSPDSAEQAQQAPAVDAHRVKKKKPSHEHKDKREKKDGTKKIKKKKRAPDHVGATIPSYPPTDNGAGPSRHPDATVTTAPPRAKQTPVVSITPLRPITAPDTTPIAPGAPSRIQSRPQVSPSIAPGSGGGAAPHGGQMNAGNTTTNINNNPTSSLCPGGGGSPSFGVSARNGDNPIVAISTRLVSPDITSQMPAGYVGKYLAALMKLSPKEKMEQAAVVSNFVESGLIQELVVFIGILVN